ncbi:hypothetical protein R1sor_009777 [Riccia sorocarpa]|uniref:Reverse transcriptase domain-containing protein n=1 Tax=Riccia sorocarpa TaxID=122646 RepID=A0ABD3HXJ7_9MARC
MGMAQRNVERVQGLVIGGAAQIHVNGRFIGRFEVTRGVMQGCPLAPLLFAMVTQPLMRLLREEERCGRLHGVNYGGPQTLLHQIYADDTGVNLTMEEVQFSRLTEVIQVYERISGAKLNVAKSLIMPISPSIPGWLEETRCEVAGPGKEFIYLGVNTSNPVNENQIVQLIRGKMMKRLSHWSNRFLSWPARIVLLKQVLAATPLYQLLSVGMETDGIEGLEILCRQFLWGWADQDSPKASLVAWERVSQRKKDGEIGWTSLLVKARALQVKNVVKIMSNSSAEWTKLAQSLILRTLRSGRYQSERRQWRVSDALLLTQMTKVTGSRTLTRMLTAWKHVRAMIKWQDSCREIPGHLTMDQGVQLMQWGDKEEILRFQKITGLLRKAGIHTLREGQEENRNNRSWQEALAVAGIFPEEIEMVKIQRMEEWLQSKILVNKELYEVDGWRWGLASRLEEMRNCGGMPTGCNSLLGWLDHALERAKVDTSYLWLFGTYLAITWAERNDLRFNGKRNHRPLRAILRLTALEIEAFPGR